MSQPEADRAYARAEGYLPGPQADVKRLFHQVSDVLSVDDYGDGLVRLRIAGTHNDDFCVVIDAAGRIGWALR